MFSVNPTTLSGCMDIVVIRQPDGTYKSSPFHIRFGKFKVFSNARKTVHISINNEENRQVMMQLSSSGQAYFPVVVQRGKEEEVGDRVEDEGPQVTHLEGGQNAESQGEYEQLAQEHEGYMEAQFAGPVSEEKVLRNTVVTPKGEMLQGKGGVRKKLMTFFNKKGN